MERDCAASFPFAHVKVPAPIWIGERILSQVSICRWFERPVRRTIDWIDREQMLKPAPNDFCKGNLFLLSQSPRLLIKLVRKLDLSAYH